MSFISASSPDLILHADCGLSTCRLELCGHLHGGWHEFLLLPSHLSGREPAAPAAGCHNHLPADLGRLWPLHADCRLVYFGASPSSHSSCFAFPRYLIRHLILHAFRFQQQWAPCAGKSWDMYSVPGRSIEMLEACILHAYDSSR